MSLTAVRVLEKAYALMDTPGVMLAKGTYGGEDERRFCALGALRQVAFGETHQVSFSHENWKGYFAASQGISDRLREQGFTHIPSWNDKVERTKADVLALFRAVAAEVQAEHDGQ